MVDGVAESWMPPAFRAMETSTSRTSWRLGSAIVRMLCWCCSGCVGDSEGGEMVGLRNCLKNIRSTRVKQIADAKRMETITNRWQR